MENDFYQKIDAIIKNVDKHTIEPNFQNELKERNNKLVSNILTDNDIIEIFINIIAYSQNANSKLVEQIIDSKIFEEIFAKYDINEIIKMNPCDLADKYWIKIRGIRQQAKLFHIVSLARKIKKLGSFNKLLTETRIPKKMKTTDDIANFWAGFIKLKNVMNENKIPFFRSTTSLLHLLLNLGYDCVKPDLVIMKVAKRIGIIEKESGDKNLIKAVKMIQEYSLSRNIRPPVIDLYFLIDGGQAGAKKFVKKEYYKLESCR